MLDKTSLGKGDDDDDDDDDGDDDDDDDDMMVNQIVKIFCSFPVYLTTFLYLYQDYYCQTS